MNLKKALSLLVAAAVPVTGLLSGAVTVGAKSEFDFSDEYKGTQYYTKLMAALDASADKTTMERTLAVAQSQKGYKNYATDGIDVEQARKDGLLWTGAQLRMSEDNTGNTEYTRWAQRYVMDRDESTQYVDVDWCAIFASWCMYQAGYYDKETLKRYYYSYYADPREEYDYDSWVTAFNLEQKNVWYTPKASKKISSYDWSTYVHTDVDAAEIPYKPGGLIFFTWDGSGSYFNHVAFVESYDEETHVLTYLNGNSDGQVISREIDLDVEEEYRSNALALNADRIMAYGEYDEIKPFEKREIRLDSTEIEWDLQSPSGLKIQTDSESKICSVYVDGKYRGSNIESNMLFHGGKLSVGKSELQIIPVGSYNVVLEFDDGTASFILRVFDSSNPTEAPTTEPATETPTEPVTEAEAKTDITSLKATLSKTTYTYSGKAHKPAVTVKGLPSSAYTVSYRNNVKAGTATVTITGKGNYTGKITKAFKITQAKNPMKVRANAKSVKLSSLKKKNLTVKNAITVRNNQGSLCFAAVRSGTSKGVTISKSGVITIRKGAAKKKTTLKLTANVTAKGNANYKKLTNKVTVKIKVR